jgi:hypothetical protein
VTVAWIWGSAFMIRPLIDLYKRLQKIAKRSKHLPFEVGPKDRVWFHLPSER